jgi:hypothetical protein
MKVQWVMEKRLDVEEGDKGELPQQKGVYTRRTLVCTMKPSLPLPLNLVHDE